MGERDRQEQYQVFVYFVVAGNPARNASLVVTADCQSV